MDSPNSSPGQEKQGEYQWREMIRRFQITVLIIKDWQFTGLLFSLFFLAWRTVWGIHLARRRKSHLPPLVSETIRLQMLWLTIVDLLFATRGRNKTYPGCLVSSSCCEEEVYDGQPKHLKPNGFTYQWREMIRRFQITVLIFQPTLKVLADLERDDPKFEFPAARLVGLYRRLWES
jgi:hypothetical protein